VRVIESRSFHTTVKRLHANQKQHLDNAVRAVMENPALGEMKAGDLAGLRVFKFRMVNHLTLLAYRYDGKTNALALEALGSHENFYRDLKAR
jgi:mRNA-degrading endonuclease YafQ of YafQ-DinJ toxin-antitoxin module